MSRSEKKKSWREIRRQTTPRRQKKLEAERNRKEKQSQKSRGWSRSKALGIGFLLLMVPLAAVYVAWQSAQPSDAGELPLLYSLIDADFSEFRGKVVLVDCFATWCQPCIAEIPHLAEISGNYDSSEVVVVSVGSYGDSATGLRRFKRDHDITWRVARDTVGVFTKFNVDWIPTIVILDGDGNIHFTKVGLTEASVLSYKIDELLSP